MKLGNFALVFAGLMTVGDSALATDISPDHIRQYIEVLASDSLEGREVGEPGEQKAAAYIARLFESFGLTPLGDDETFYQSFEFTKKIVHGEKNRLFINGVEMRLGENYIPMNQSASMAFDFDTVIPVGYGITVEHSSHDDYYGKEVTGKAVMIMRYSPGDEPASDTLSDGLESGLDSAASTGVEWHRYSSLTDKILNALDHGAAGVLFVTPDYQDDTMISLGVTRVNPKEIPILFVKRSAFDKAGLDPAGSEYFSAAGETDLIRVRDTGRNVIAYLPTTNDTTIVIGAHYDHLGWGTPASLYRGREPRIHYGADDNGSGTAGLLELARYYASNAKPQKYSLLFCAFSGEESGLLGSSKYAKNMTIDSSKVRMMVNMDMIGRLADQENGLAIFGTGTCVEFKQYFDSLEYGDLKMTLKESGTGPSDHTAFYNRDIPVLHFFTGAHEDYHKPSDVVSLIDFDGTATVARLITTIVDHFDNYQGPLTFRRTKDENSGRRRAAFSVTLGLMPDYVSEVLGLKIDGLTPDKPAERAGIQKGDIIVQMGKYRIDDIYAYMNALGKFRKGDTVTVVLDRNGDTVQVVVDFN